MAVCGGIVLEEALDLSSDRILNECDKVKENSVSNCDVFEAHKFC